MDTEQTINNVKGKTSLGCLTGCLVLVFLTVGIPFIFFSYHLSFKETELITSYSPDQKHVIEILEKGSAVVFGPSDILVKYQEQSFDTTISNDGANITEENISITWTSDYTAVITLDGVEQNLQTIIFNSENNPVFTSE